jgi:hypothetical protein
LEPVQTIASTITQKNGFVKGNILSLRGTLVELREALQTKGLTPLNQNKKASPRELAFLFLFIENGLEEDCSCLRIEEVNLVSIDSQHKILTDMRTGAWIDARYHLFPLGGHVY